MTGRVYQRAAEVMETDVGDEVVAFDLRSGETFALNQVAASVWRHLAEPRSFEQLRNALLDGFDVPLEQCTIELERLLEELAKNRLVEMIG